MQKPKVPDPEKFLNGFHRPELILAPMTIRDLDEVLEIERLSFATPWTRQQFLDEIERNPLSNPMVLRTREADGLKMLGFCVCWMVSGELHINNIAVHPESRRHGFGEFLMRWALDFANAAGSRRAVLEVRTSNQPAIHLYRRLGFETLGVAPAYYEDTGEDAFILVKKLKA